MTDAEWRKKAEELLRAYQAKESDRWRDWNGGNTGECPCETCDSARALLAPTANISLANGSTINVAESEDGERLRGAPAEPQEERWTLEEIEDAVRRDHWKARAEALEQENARLRDLHQCSSCGNKESQVWHCLDCIRGRAALSPIPVSGEAKEEWTTEQLTKVFDAVRTICGKDDADRVDALLTGRDVL